MRLTINDETAERLMAAARSQESASATVERLLDESVSLMQTRAKLTSAKLDIGLLKAKIDTLERIIDNHANVQRHSAMSRSQRQAIDEARKAFQEFTGDDPECTGAW